MIISFAKTVDEFSTGIKTATRRIWKEKYFQQWCRMWDNDKRVHQAYSKSPRSGGVKIGEFRLTKRPYKQKLSQMTQYDLLAEGGMCATVKEFCELIQQPPETEVTVVEFEPLPYRPYPVEVWPYRHTGWNGLLVPASTAHPAKMARWILENIFDIWIKDEGLEIYDPFAGVGTTAVIGYSRGHSVMSCELEPEFYNILGANLSKIHREVNKVVQRGDLYLSLRNEDSSQTTFGVMDYDMVITSPPYADVVKGGEGPSARHDFETHSEEKAQTAVSRADYGKKKGQIGNLGWHDYWDSMNRVYENCHWSLRGDGVMVVVVKDYIREGRYMRFPDWTIKAIESSGFKVEKVAHAMLIEEEYAPDLFGGESLIKSTAHESMWRRISREQGLPIDYEVVIYARRVES